MKRRGTIADREGLLAPLFLLPAVIYIFALVAIPFVLAIAFSFSDITAGDPTFHWAGLDNYRAIFHDPVFLPATSHVWPESAET